jgi:hypothetical protein
MKKLFYLLPILSLLATTSVTSQAVERVYNTFNSTRVINSHSTETLWRNELDVRIGHRFGDFSGQNGGVKTMFGLDNSADISVGFEYGATNDLDIGLTRYKGAGPYKQLLEGYAKYKFLKQTTKMPISLVGIAKVYGTLMEASKDSMSPNAYTEFSQRLAYSYQLLISKKFSDRFSLQIMPTYVHRNFVAFQDQNVHIAMGAGFKFQVNKLIGIIGEYHYVIKDETLAISKALKDPLGLAVEFNTGGHVFQLNFTNSRGFGEAQYISSTTSDFTKGQYRIGFTISRVFKL